MTQPMISVDDALLSDTVLQVLTDNGFGVKNDDSHAWLALIDLSRCALDKVHDVIKSVKATHCVALLEPEQSDLAMAAMKAGVHDYLLLPVDPIQLLQLVLRLQGLEQQDAHFVAAAQNTKQLLMLAHRAAMTDASVLLTGESGTGKEPLSRYIHRNSTRMGKPFIAVNCAAIPESILESILFGHVKGAFTGATSDQPGKFEQANGGTLMLDEIGEMPLLLQAKLLRVLQEREVERLGGHKPIPLNVRIIAATNRDLRKAVQAGEFREDLFYRLDVLPLSIPPLRQRKEDIFPLAEYFIQRYEHLTQGQSCSLTPAAKNLLLQHDWPGNVRELENTIQRALVLRRGPMLQAADLGIATANQVGSIIAAEDLGTARNGLKASKKNAEFQYIIDTLRRFAGHRARSAEALGMTTRALRYKLAQMREAGVNVEQVIESNHYTS